MGWESFTWYSEIKIMWNYNTIINSVGLKIINSFENISISNDHPKLK